MQVSTGILIDKCVILGECFRRINQESEFFNYLSSNPEIGLITDSIVAGVESNIHKEKMRDSKKTKALREFQGMKKFLKTERIDPSQVNRKIDLVEKFFEEVIKEEIGYSDRVIPGLYRSPRFHLEDYKKSLIPEREDKVIIAEGLHLKEKYPNLYLASYDRHFLNEPIPKRIEEQFGIICDLPFNILRKLGRY